MSPIRSQQSRRITSLLVERKVSGVAMVVVLATALICGVIGFAFHPFWIFAIVVLALGLGYVVANARQNRIDVETRSEEDG
jgi:general stress protein CsbA